MRVNFQEDDARSAFKEYQSVDFSLLNPYFDILLEQIPQEYLQNGSSVEQYQKLKDKSLSLFQILFSDIGDRIRECSNTKSPKNLQIVIDEEIAHIPFEILHSGENFLWEGFIINRQIATSSFNQSQTNKEDLISSTISLVGNPSEDSEIDSSIRTELLDLNEILDDVTEVNGPHFGREINQYHLTEILNTSDIFHFSGHFRVNENRQTGWELADNQFFTTSHIHKMRKVPRFIFSNTCGEQNGISTNGFIREFLNSGVQTYLTAIGKVPTDEAGFFSKEFYRSLIKGKTVGESVYHSKKELVKRYGISNLAWMFFALYGNGSLTLFPKLKYKKKIKWQGAVLSLMLCFGLITVFNFSKDYFHTESLIVSTHPSNSEILIDGQMLGCSPLKVSVKKNQSISVIKEGFDTLYCHLDKVNERWGLVIDGNYNGIVQKSDVSRILPVYTSDESIPMIPNNLHTILFENINSSVIIHRSSIKFNGKAVKLAVDKYPHRYLVMLNGKEFNSRFTVQSDTTITKSDILEYWNPTL
ncbi:MAG: CHAT domain-containing protein [Candidatus Marinimicrobia bacterium]|nr:CHAT domain-containing protein [Candidatus Neomarinimicrobiota bacterium]